MPALPDVEPAVRAILNVRTDVSPARGVLVGVTGIDGSGKGCVAEKPVASLRERGFRAVAINVDGWLNLPEQRFDTRAPAEHFYEHAIRFEALFDRLILPLKAKRSHRVVADFAEETATALCPHTYAYEDVDVIVLERIFLLKRAHRAHFDLSF